MGSSKRELSHWNTTNELQVLDGLGSFGRSGRDREWLLRRYRDEYMPRRVNWGEIDFRAVAIYIHEQLKAGGVK